MIINVSAKLVIREFIVTLILMSVSRILVKIRGFVLIKMMGFFADVKMGSVVRFVSGRLWNVYRCRVKIMEPVTSISLSPDFTNALAQPPGQVSTVKFQWTIAEASHVTTPPSASINPTYHHLTVFAALVSLEINATST